MDCFWCCCDTNCRLVSVTKIHLGKQSEGGKVTFGDNREDNGKLQYLESPTGNLMLVEFAAGKRASWKRHIFHQVDNSQFKLIDEHDPLDAMYTQKKWWSPWGEKRRNKDPVYLQQFKVS